MFGVIRSLPGLCDVGHFVVSQFNPVQVSGWSDLMLLWVFLCVAHFPHIFLLMSLHSRFPTLTIFQRFLPLWSIRCFSSCHFLLIGFSLFRLEEFVDLIFPSSFWSSYGSVGLCILYWVQGSLELFSLPIFRLVAMRFSSPVSISFFCEFWSSIGYLYFSTDQWLHLCFSSYIQTILFLQCQLCLFPHQYRSRRRCRCPDRSLCLSWARLQFHLQSFPSFLRLLFHLSHFPVSQFLQWLYFHLCFESFSVFSIRFYRLTRSILRCVDWIILSCSFVRVHVPEA